MCSLHRLVSGPPWSMAALGSQATQMAAPGPEAAQGPMPGFQETEQRACCLLFPSCGSDTVSPSVTSVIVTGPGEETQTLPLSGRYVTVTS